MCSSVVEFIIDSDSDNEGSDRELSPARSDAVPSTNPSVEPQPTQRRRSSSTTNASFSAKPPSSKHSLKSPTNESPRQSGRLADPNYKSFACNVCHKCFNFKVELLRHKLSHYEHPKNARLPSARDRWRNQQGKSRVLKKKNMENNRNNLKTTKKVVSRRNQALDDPLLLMPLEQGWQRLVVYRQSDLKTCDVYYKHPDGKKFRSLNEVSKVKLESGLSLIQFSFARCPLDLLHPNQVVLNANSKVNSSPVTHVKKPPKIAQSDENTDSKFLHPLNNGWSRFVVRRSSKSLGSDVYYVDPEGREFRSVSDLRTAKFKKGITMDHFSFKRCSLNLKHPNEIVRTAGKIGNRPPVSKTKKQLFKSKNSSTKDLQKTKTRSSHLKHSPGDQLYLPPLNRGWSRLMVLRKSRIRMKSSNYCDIYYVSPTGKKFRSLTELGNALKYEPEKGLSVENFCFTKRKLDLDHPKQVVQKSGSQLRKRAKARSPVLPLRPLSSVTQKRRTPVKIRWVNCDPKLNFLSQLELDSKALQPRVVLRDYFSKKSPDGSVTEEQRHEVAAKSGVTDGGEDSQSESDSLQNEDDEDSSLDTGPNAIDNQDNEATPSEPELSPHEDVIPNTDSQIIADPSCEENPANCTETNVEAPREPVERLKLQDVSGPSGEAAAESFTGTNVEALREPVQSFELHNVSGPSREAAAESDVDSILNEDLVDEGDSLWVPQPGL